MAVEDEIVARLDEYAVPLAGTAPGADTADLLPVAEAIDGARVVGLGEATHGTREFFQLKHRIVRLLVTKLDFRLFGLEANFVETQPIDEYVVSGDGDPEKALGELDYWTWNTEEMLALVEWLREYNDGRPAAEKVRFFGYDVQSARGPAWAIRRLLARADPGYLDEIGDDLATLEAGPPGNEYEALREWLIAAETVTTLLESRFERHEDRYRSAASDGEWRLLHRYRRLVEQARELQSAKSFADAGTPNGVRDAAMAENVSWFLDHHDADRIALWAHNGHVGTGTFRGGDWDTPPETMGQHLRREFGDEYYALGFEFGRGSFRARPDPEAVADQRVRTFTLDSPPDGSVPAVLAAVDAPLWYLDVAAASDDPTVGEWLGRERRLHGVGAVFFDDEDEEYVPVELATEFDGLVFVAETTSAVPVGEG